jgi:hypothetical protein
MATAEYRCGHGTLFFQLNKARGVQTSQPAKMALGPLPPDFGGNQQNRREIGAFLVA